MEVYLPSPSCIYRDIFSQRGERYNMKKQHLIILSLIVLSLTACSKDKPVEATTAPIETIQPTESETELNDSIDSTSETLVIQGVAIGADGKEMTPEEAAAYEESIRHDSLIETSPVETLSEQELSEASERDFTPEEYEQIQDGIEEWNNIEADMIKVE